MERTLRKKAYLSVLLGAVMLLTACNSAPPMSVDDDPPVKTTPVSISEDSNVPTTSNVDPDKPLRDPTPLCLTCDTPGTLVDGNEYVEIDYSNNSDGYVMVNYLGDCVKVKLQITGPDQVTYTYNLNNGYVAFPLSAGSGEYTINVAENIVDSKYSLVFGGTYTFDQISEFGPYLHPNQYVSFDSTKKTVAKGQELATGCYDEIGVITNIYDYITANITYDYDKAETVPSGYLSDVDSTLATGTGICLDYAAVMCTMLRSQQIPTKLEVGYVGEDMVYHAWISIYVEDVGWLNGIIQFNGKEWSLVDPTFGSNMSDKSLKSFIGDGTNYSVKYAY